MKKVSEKIMGLIFPNKKKTKENVNYKQKWVTFVLTHQTSFLTTGWSYLTQKEDDRWHWFNFDGKIIKYPKDYFVDGCELN